MSVIKNVRFEIVDEPNRITKPTERTLALLSIAALLLGWLVIAGVVIWFWTN